ncbi:MAG: chitobiase/beta-hexosaminidase C-terminal domain-containing protein [Deltaproteobacteria bacterium]|nr:chitobiase/beta-hexosaminidase C-terminal domain-containing protein [Deltaproteobacteria bacterium]
MPESEEATCWHVSDLKDNTLYHWRVRANDGTACSHWSVGQFFVNLQNDPPDAPVVKNPGSLAWTETLTPALELHPAPDADGDALSYELELYGSAGSFDFLARSESAYGVWVMDPPLDDATWYYWRARAVDEHGAASDWGDETAFFVKDNGVDDPPEFQFVQPDQDLLTQGGVLLAWSDADPDSNAGIDLYYDTDGSGADGVLIQSGLEEDPEGPGDTWVWDMAGLPDGVYYVYAHISDGVGSNTVYNAYSVTLDRTPPAVVADPRGGIYPDGLDVTLTALEPVDIVYTTDGTDPADNGLPYTGPITLSETTTLKFMGIDAAGNAGDVYVENYTIGQVPEQFSVTVETDKGRSLSGVRVYAFKDGGAYTGYSGTTDDGGISLFQLADFPDGAYRFRIDYLGHRFWSETVNLPGAYALTVTIGEETVSVTAFMSTGPVEGIPVYVFSGSGSYLGVKGTTDAAGAAAFELPVGVTFMFRADLFRNQYWSDPWTVQSGGPNDVTIDAGGGSLEMTLEDGLGIPMADVRVYLFNGAGAYLGRSGDTDETGWVGFDVPEGTYKLRMDYLGYQFWTDDMVVSGDTDIVHAIPHQPVAVDVAAEFQGGYDPLTDVRAYLFSASGAYQGVYANTDIDGRVAFELPEREYMVRADYMKQQFWSDAFTWQDTVIAVPMAEADILFTASGGPKEGVRVYAFTAGGAYLGMYGNTDVDGKTLFRLPAGAYKFRADYLSNQYWSVEETLLPDQIHPIDISAGGGDFHLTGGRTNRSWASSATCSTRTGPIPAFRALPTPAERCRLTCRAAFTCSAWTTWVIDTGPTRSASRTPWSIRSKSTMKTSLSP